MLMLIIIYSLLLIVGPFDPVVPETNLHYPVEGEALEHREHEHRTEEHDVRFADREPRFTTPSS